MMAVGALGVVLWLIVWAPGLLALVVAARSTEGKYRPTRYLRPARIPPTNELSHSRACLSRLPGNGHGRFWGTAARQRVGALRNRQAVVTGLLGAGRRPQRPSIPATPRPASSYRVLRPPGTSVTSPHPRGARQVIAHWLPGYACQVGQGRTACPAVGRGRHAVSRRVRAAGARA